MSGVAVVGATNVDLITYVDTMPKIGETVSGNRFESGFGGKGANQAFQAAILAEESNEGPSILFVGKVGEDHWGVNTKQHFIKNKFHEDFIYTTNESSSGLAPIFVDSQGNNSIVIINGANDCLTHEEINASREEMSKCKVLLTQLELKQELTLTALRLGKELGLTTILNTAPAPSEPLSEDLIEATDIVCANEPELETLTGLTINDEKDAVKGAKMLIEQGINKVLITLGSKGCALVEKNSDDEYVEIYVPVKKVDVVDTTGAGDSFLGAFGYFVAHGFPMKECLEKSNTVASISVTQKGTQSSYAKRSDLPSDLFTSSKNNDNE